ncbi:hypothetical protein CA54_06590 [Symmachiella macrocystis]|uniref:Uncharacterized protein n=1 Tax=Symmachiella macrocystis TaxID=2527985 RepID=A0A5C6BJK7_9PLAN|nr:hypothetical protein [Symmachiella macrocystis]TWU11847.1 hypothetical protein CA54_06590 [Symmachiella macrocystis]
MSITVRCPCGKAYKVADKLAGKKIKCKSCDKVLAIAQPRAKTKREVASSDDDSGFLDVDLDAEYSQMTAVKRARPRQDESESQFADPFERRGLAAAGLDVSQNKEPRFFIPSMPRVEKVVSKLIPLMGVVLGLLMIFGTYLISVHYGYFWPFLGAAGIVVSIVSLNLLFKKEEEEEEAETE